MFERKADLAETEMLIHCHGDYSKKKNYREGWQEGATFGYNKAKEELRGKHNVDWRKIKKTTKGIEQDNSEEIKYRNSNLNYYIKIKLTAKTINHCKEFVFNPIDAFNVEKGKYKPREKKVDNGQGSLF